MPDNPTPDSAAQRIHLDRHLTDGRWHDGCRYCLPRRVRGGTGVTEADRA